MDRLQSTTHIASSQAHPRRGSQFVPSDCPKFSYYNPQGCFSFCGTTFDLTSSGRCCTCLAFMLHYQACRLLREVAS